LTPTTRARTVFLLLILAVFFGGVLPVTAQDSEPSAESLKRIRTALQDPHPLGSEGVTFRAPSTPDALQWGIVTFTQPDTPGQFLSIRVPIGDLVSRAAHSIASAQRRRAQERAHADVVKALTEFREAQAVSR
jgi:hypothetical protein